jgi:hypothetical protein
MHTLFNNYKVNRDINRKAKDYNLDNTTLKLIFLETDSNV